MKALTSMVTKGFSVADIGCDHGYVSICLYKEGTAPFCIASDVRMGPAEAARKNVSLYEAEKGVSVRLGSGLETIRPGETDCILIAGMGGKTIVSILSGQPVTASCAKELVLGPQSEIPEVRRYLCERDFSIRDEKLILEDGKFYPLIRAVPQSVSKDLKPEEIQYGPVLLQKKDPVLLEMLHKQVRLLTGIIENLKDGSGERAGRRKTELMQELALAKKALQYYPKQEEGTDL